jgi:2-oxoglutarate dehydrogenase complex dehydrogenase (E1) component-like enzyme
VHETQNHAEKPAEGTLFEAEKKKQKLSQNQMPVVDRNLYFQSVGTQHSRLSPLNTEPSQRDKDTFSITSLSFEINEQDEQRENGAHSPSTAMETKERVHLHFLYL